MHCRDCGFQSATSSDFCPKCGAPQEPEKRAPVPTTMANGKKSNKLRIVLWIVGAVLVLALVNGVLEKSAQPSKQAIQDDRSLTDEQIFGFMSLAEQDVRNILKAPKTAKFPNHEWTVFRVKNVVSVMSYVDSENSFGAMLRAEFGAQYDFVTQKLLYLEFDGKKIYGNLQDNLNTSPSTEPAKTNALPDPSKIKSFSKSGHGDDVFQFDIDQPWLYRCTATHNGERNFIVDYSVSGKKENAINAIRNFSGAFLLGGWDEDYMQTTIQVRADGDWSFKVVPLNFDGNMQVTGKGMYVSDLFDGDGEHVFRFTHTGQSNFAVFLLTQDGRDLIVNEIGEYEGKIMVDTTDGLALWEVIADGHWSITKAD